MSSIVSKILISGLSKLLAHVHLAGFFEDNTLPDRTYLISLGLILTMVVQITSALIYQMLSMAINCSKGDLTESLSLGTCFVYYSIFLILKMVGPSMYPVHWMILSGRVGVLNVHDLH